MTTEIIQRGRVISKATGFTGGCGFDYNLNTALGCRFGCSYCYAENFTQQYAPPGQEWGEWTKLKAHAAQEVLDHSSLSGKSIYMSTSTDPYQPAEAKHGITRGVLESLLSDKHSGVKLVAQTRSPLVVRDADLLTRIHERGLVQVNMTVSTNSDEVRKRFEPTCPPVDKRLSAVEQLVAAGLQCAVTVTPMLPLTDVQGFAERLAGMGLASVVIQPFHQQRTAAHIRSTKQEALDVLSELDLNLEDLKRQANRLWYALKQRGVTVGVNQSGFNVPSKLKA